MRLEIVLILTQDRCRVYAECTIDSEIILDAPNGTVGCCESCGISFRSVLETMLVSVQDSRTVCAKCTTVLDIVLDTHEGSAR